MKVKELIEMSNETFTVMVKEPEKCFSYSCTSNNVSNHEDFSNREIYKFDFDSRKVYCW